MGELMQAEKFRWGDFLRCVVQRTWITCPPMTIKELIKALGGPKLVSGQLGLGMTAVSNWSANDAIPAAHRLTVWRLAIDHEIDWTPPDATGLALVRRSTETQEPAP